MMDLRNSLEDIAGPVAPPTAAEVDADLARGRRALRRRRASRAIAGSAFAAAGVVAAVSVSMSATPAPTVTPDDRPAVVTETKLVAYHGAQPKGYTIDKVPNGWEIQGVNEYSLTLAPIGAADQNPDSFVGKIAIMLQSRDQHDVPDGKPVKVGDKDGVLVQVEGDSAMTLWIEQPTGAHLLIQFWHGLGLSEAEMTELAAGVHVHKDAKQGVG